MKIKIIILSLFTTLLLSLQPVSAGTNTNCISAQNGRSSMTSSTLTLSADLYWNCSDAPMDGSVTYSISEDSSVYCTGPSYASKASTYTNTYAGVVSCAINIVNSGRAGSSTSTLRIWSAYDFSTKYITIYHQQIPSKFTPTPLPLPTSNPQPTVPSEPTKQYYPDPIESDLQACTKGGGQPYWHCEKAPTWRYVVCVSASKGFLQVYTNKKWRNFKRVSATYKPSSCGESLPWSVFYYGTQSQTSGTYRYRLYFPEENKNRMITESKFTVKVLYGGLDMDAD
jgi:hypothetical protein